MPRARATRHRPEHLNLHDKYKGQAYGAPQQPWPSAWDRRASPSAQAVLLGLGVAIAEHCLLPFVGSDLWLQRVVLLLNELL